MDYPSSVKTTSFGKTPRRKSNIQLDLTYLKRYGFYVFLLGLLLTLFISLFQLVKQYQTSLKWTEHHPQTQTLAQLDPDVLFDDHPLSRQAKLDFKEQVEYGFNEETRDFKIPLTQGYLDQLTTYFNQIDPLSKERYQSLYLEIQSKGEIQLAYNNLFQDALYKVLKPNVTPEGIYTLNQTYFPYLEAQYRYRRGQDAFVVRLYNLQLKLTQDANHVSDLLVRLNEAMDQPPEGNTVYVSNTLYPEEQSALSDTVLNLQYQWPMLNTTIHLIHTLEPIAKANALRHQRYEEYRLDQKRKDFAYYNLEQRILSLNDRLKNERTTDLEALKQREKERLQRDREEAEQSKNATTTPKTSMEPSPSESGSQGEETTQEEADNVLPPAEEAADIFESD